jgi:hypothetical protein
MVLFEFKLISPLAVKFSQSRVRPEFQDGRLLDDSFEACQATESPIEGYDCCIIAPFPPIEIVRWRPRVHHDDGALEYNEEGSTTLGEETWYTLDNRRLVCLQRKAAEVWPKVACVPVVVLDELPKQSAARKFRSLDYGKSVRIGHRFQSEEYWLWSWVETTQQKKASPAEALRALEMCKTDKDTFGIRLHDAPDEMVDEMEQLIETAQEYEEKKSAARQAERLREAEGNYTNANSTSRPGPGNNTTPQQAAGAQILAMVRPGSTPPCTPPSEPKPAPTGIKLTVDDLFRSAINGVN